MKIFNHPKNYFVALALFSFLLTLSACENKVPRKTDALLKITENKKSHEINYLRHVVLFKFNEKATKEIVLNIEQAFAALPEKISEIHAFEWGLNNSPEGLNNGLTHCFFVSFLSEEDRAAYLPHPAHQKFVELITPYVESVTVVDYWTS